MCILCADTLFGMKSETAAQSMIVDPLGRASFSRFSPDK